MQSSEEYLDQLLASVNDNRENVIPPEEEILYPQEEIAAPKEEILYPQEEIAAPKEEILYPQEEIAVPKEEIHYPQEEIVAPEEIDLPDRTEVQARREQRKAFEQEESVGEENKVSEDEQLIDADELQNLEDIDAMLQRAKQMEPKAASQPIMAQDSELDTLLSSLGNDDSDLKEISDILSKSEQNEPVDDDLLSMLEGLDTNDSKEQGMFDNTLPAQNENTVTSDKEIEQIDAGPDSLQQEQSLTSAKDRKRKEKLQKKAAKDAAKKAAREAKKDRKKESSLYEEAVPKEEKKGFFAKLFSKLDEEDEEEEIEEIEEKPKKEKREKKNKKGSKSKNMEEAGTPTDENAQIEAQLEKEDKNAAKNREKEKAKKEKKAAREQKRQLKQQKNAEKDAVFEKGHKIGKKGITVTFLFCFTLLGILLLIAYFVPMQFARKDAREAYYQQNYEQTVALLMGKKLNESDLLLYKKASLLNKIGKKYEEYPIYQKLEQHQDALNALLQARILCNQSQIEAMQLDIEDEWKVFINQIDSQLLTDYKLDADAVDDICQMRPLAYTLAVENILAGKAYNDFDEILPLQSKEEEALNSAQEPETSQEQEPEIQDILPMEEPILEGINQTQEPDEDINLEEPVSDEISGDTTENLLYSGTVTDGKVILGDVQ